MSVTITTPSGSTTIQQARVVQDVQEYALTRRLENGRIVTMGDRLQNVAPLIVEFGLQGPVNGDTGGEADDLIVACLAATSVSTWRGDRAVNGVLRTSIESDGVLVTVRAEFAPTGGVYT